MHELQMEGRGAIWKDRCDSKNMHNQFDHNQGPVPVIGVQSDTHKQEIDLNARILIAKESAHISKGTLLRLLVETICTLDKRAIQQHAQSHAYPHDKYA